MSEFEKLFDVIKSSAVNEYKKIWGTKLAEMHDVALEQMKPIFKAVYAEGAKNANNKIAHLEQQLSEAHASRASWVEYSQKLESGEFVLVPHKPTKEMLQALESGFEFDHSESNYDAACGYEAMIEAVEKNNK